MTVRTKTEKLGLEKFSTVAREKLIITANRKSIDFSRAEKLRVFFGTGSLNIAIEKSISLVAARLLVEGADLLDSTKMDKVELVRDIQTASMCERHFSSRHDLVKFKAMTWELLVVVSQARILISTKEDLINYCLDESFVSLQTLFGES